MDWEIELRSNFRHHALESQGEYVEQKHAKKLFTRHKIYHTEVNDNLALIHDFLY